MHSDCLTLRYCTLFYCIFFGNYVLPFAWNVCGLFHGDARKKSFHPSQSKYSWCKDTQRLTQYTWSNSERWHGNTMVNLDWGPSAGFPPHPLDSVHFPLRNKPVEVYRDLQRLAPGSLKEARARWLHHIYFPSGQPCIFMSVCVYLLASRSECVVWWDKDAGEPHPSTNSDINRCSAHIRV